MPFDDTTSRADNPTVVRLRKLKKAILMPNAWCQKDISDVYVDEAGISHVQYCLIGWMQCLGHAQLVEVIEPVIRGKRKPPRTVQEAVDRLMLFNDAKKTTPERIAEALDQAIEAASVR